MFAAIRKQKPEGWLWIGDAGYAGLLLLLLLLPLLLLLLQLLLLVLQLERLLLVMVFVLHALSSMQKVMTCLL